MSAKNLDKKGRFRDKVIAFRVSSKENEILERKVALSGITKQDYLIKCIEEVTINIEPNFYILKSLVRELKHIDPSEEEVNKYIKELLIKLSSEEINNGR